MLNGLETKIKSRKGVCDTNSSITNGKVDLWINERIRNQVKGCYLQKVDFKTNAKI